MPFLIRSFRPFRRPDQRDDTASSRFAAQAERLGQYRSGQETNGTASTQAAEAIFVTPLDPVVETVNRGRLPVVPIEEAGKLNAFKARAEDREPRSPPAGSYRAGRDGALYGTRRAIEADEELEDAAKAPLREAVPPSHTHPLFPPLPMYGPPTIVRSVQCWIFRLTSAVLSLAFLLTIVTGATLGSFRRLLRDARYRALLRSPPTSRPFHDEEVKRAEERKGAEDAWLQRQRQHGPEPATPLREQGGDSPDHGAFLPTEGGPDPLLVDVAYYARRVGLDAETFEVQTEDGYIIELWHIFNPMGYNRPSSPARKQDGPDVFVEKTKASKAEAAQSSPHGDKKYPVLMMHGLLQAAGAFCANDDDSLAFYLAKSGYDVWLGNNRCGLKPKHTLLDYNDPRMWAWNIRQMGVMDLPALISRVLAETGFPKLALVAHSQGTTQTFVALAKEQRPDLGEKISVFCALAPAVYAGPLIGKLYFKVMRLISPAVFRMIFGIHAFIPLMGLAHDIMPPRLYSWMAYHVFSHLFGWSDARWERGLRNRMFQWAPTYVSAESMRWWLGRECFATQKCILATREEGRLEDREDEEDDEIIRRAYVDREPHVTARRKLQRNLSSFHCQQLAHHHHDSNRGRYAWYDGRFPPLALWVCGADNLVDGRRLLRRFDRGREPHVRLVHKKIVEGYEHLDVIWAMDAIEKVGKEVREVIWRTVDPAAAAACRVPVGCHLPLDQTPALADDVPMANSGGRLRMASISEAGPPDVQALLGRRGVRDDAELASIDSSREMRGEHEGQEAERERFDVGHDSGLEEEVNFEDVQEKDDPLG